MYPLTSCHLSDAMDIKQRLLYSYTVYSIQHSAGAFVTGFISISPAHPHTIHSSIYELNTFYLQEKHTAYKPKRRRQNCSIYCKIPNIWGNLRGKKLVWKNPVSLVKNHLGEIFSLHPPARSV